MFRRRPRRARRSIVAEAESSQSDSALDGSRGPRGSAVRGEPTGCLHRQRGREGTLPSGATRRLEPVGRPTLGAVVSSARLRAGVAAAELTVLTPPGSIACLRLCGCGMECVQQRGTKTKCSVRKGRSLAPTGASQCRELEATSSRVWLAGLRAAVASHPTGRGGRVSRPWCRRASCASSRATR